MIHWETQAAVNYASCCSSLPGLLKELVGLGSRYGRRLLRLSRMHAWENDSTSLLWRRRWRLAVADSVFLLFFCHSNYQLGKYKFTFILFEIRVLHSKLMVVTLRCTPPEFTDSWFLWRPSCKDSILDKLTFHSRKTLWQNWICSKHASLPLKNLLIPTGMDYCNHLINCLCPLPPGLGHTVLIAVITTEMKPFFM